ncbi:MAG: hypothetical protein A2Y97_09240 [Nitrospirae bacterium RBG_13_39_12]|nr:MAG: hypothetical protein A2Y97_09240 [Nitrospirae bacterium RBG_13_39_12]
MKITNLLMLLFFIASLTISEASYAQSMIHHGTMECQPTYGHYWRGDKWGWYGARKVVRTPVEAREILENFFMSDSGVKVGKIRVRSYFFEADIINRKGMHIDMVIIDKRTGRIRSIY